MPIASSKFIGLTKNTLNRLDINDESFSSILKNSKIILFIDGILQKFRLQLAPLTQNCWFIQKIDFFITGLIVTLLFSIITANTKTIGLISISIILLSIFKTLVIPNKESENPLSAINIPIFLYFLIAAISVAFSSLLIPSIKGYTKMIVYFGVYLSFYSFLKKSPKKSILLLAFLALVTGIEALYAIFQNYVGIEALATWQDHHGVNPEQLINRVYGSLKPYNPNLLAGFLIAGFPALLGLGTINLKNKNIKYGLLFIIGTILTTLAIVFTGSRGAYIALAAMYFLTFMISGHIIWHDFKGVEWLKKAWLYLIILGIIGIITILALSPALQHRVASIFAFRGDSSNSYRINVYISSFQMFLDNWLIGIGPGNTTFRLMYGLYMVTGFDALGAYSVPLEIATESGVFALMSFLWLIAMSFIKGVKNICKSITFENKIIISTCLIAIAGMMTHGMVDTIWYRPQIQLIFWLYIAILATMTAKSTK